MVQISTNGAFMWALCRLGGFKGGEWYGIPWLAEDEALSWVLIRPKCNEHPNPQP